MNMATSLQIGTRFDDKTIAALQKIAEREGRTVSNLIRFIVSQYITNLDNENKDKNKSIILRTNRKGVNK